MGLLTIVLKPHLATLLPPPFSLQSTIPPLPSKENIETFSRKGKAEVVGGERRVGHSASQ